jgi:tRNA splicing endonuclease
MSELTDAIYESEEARVFGTAAIQALHAWSNGGFGELLKGVAGASSGKAISFSLHLNPVEAFYLMLLDRLRIWDTSCPVTVPTESAAATVVELSANVQPMDAQRCWEAFDHAVPQLARQYAMYYTLRTSGWNLRDGLKFGVDFTLYDPAGAADSHATLGALVVDADTGADLNWIWLQRHLRVCRSVAKGLLFCCAGGTACGGVDYGGRGRGNGGCDESTPAHLSLLPMQMLAVDPWSANSDHPQLSIWP